MTRSTWPAAAALEAPAAAPSVTPVSHTYAHDSGTASSVANGVTLTNTFFKGHKIMDANGGFGSIVDDGAKTAVTVNAVTGDSEITTGNVWLTNPRLVLPTPLMGDFTYSLRFSGDSPMGSLYSQLGILVGDGDTTNQCHAVCARMGRWNTTLAQTKAYYLVDSGGTLETAAGTVAWSTTRGIQIKRTGGTMTLSARIGTGDSWVAYSTQDLDVAGGRCYASVVFYAAAAGEVFNFYDGVLTGFEWTATP